MFSPSIARYWDNVPLSQKSALLLALTLLSGILVGLVESRMGNRVWPMLLLIAGLLASLVAMGRRWIWAPLHRLLAAADRAILVDRPSIFTNLPTQRQDEIGHLGRIIHKLSVGAVRDYHEARQLRRTLDARVELATQHATRRLQELAMRDALTDLGNRRFLDENLAGIFESCRSSGTDLACLTIDMDNFKQINDTQGHAAGDDLLKFLANLIRASIRTADSAVRIGGDEFIILMPGCPLPRVRQFAEQITALFRQHVRTVSKAELRPDLSIGVSSMLRDRIDSPALLLERADSNLYGAKRAGKGRITGA